MGAKGNHGVWPYSVCPDETLQNYKGLSIRKEIPNTFLQKKSMIVFLTLSGLK